MTISHLIWTAHIQVLLQPAAESNWGNFSVKFLPTLKTDSVRPLLDRKNTAHLAVMAPDDELEEPQQEFHKVWPRCLQSSATLRWTAREMGAGW
jgi:hypothetical protein